MRDGQYFLDSSLGLLLGASLRLLRKRFDRLARSFGMTRAQRRVIAVLRRDEGINQTGMADIMDIEPITLGRHIDRLEEAGWVVHRPNLGNRRVWRIYLTDKVQLALVEMGKIAIEVRNYAMVDFLPKERERFINNLIRLKSNLAASLHRAAQEAGNVRERARMARGRRHG